MRLTALCYCAWRAFGASLASPAEAGQTHVAVAANFTEPAREIAALFKQKTGHEAVLIFGASGSFFTQITHGAPFEVFLSADSDRPKAAIDGGFAVADSLFTYAVGKLVLWSRVIDVTDGEAALKAGQFMKLSIANPVAAPYGTAAVETMKALGVYDALEAEDRAGQQHRPGVPVRRHAATRRSASSRSRSSTASRRGRAGRFPRRSIRRSGRTRCCSRRARTARRPRRSSNSSKGRRRARSSSGSATR